MFALWTGVLVYGFVAFEWHWALAGFALLIFLLVPLCSLLLMPRPCSTYYVNLIRRSLKKKLEDYYAVGDHARAEAARWVLNRLDLLYGRQSGDLST